MARIEADKKLRPTSDRHEPALTDRRPYAHTAAIGPRCENRSILSRSISLLRSTAALAESSIVPEAARRNSTTRKIHVGCSRTCCCLQLGDEDCERGANESVFSLKSELRSQPSHRAIR